MPTLEQASRVKVWGLDLVLYDATLVAPLRRDGQSQPCAAEEDGAAIAVARRRKEAQYPELRRPGPQRLVAPQAVRRAAAAGWRRRWWALLSAALQRALASPMSLHLAGPSEPSLVPLRG